MSDTRRASQAKLENDLPAAVLRPRPTAASRWSHVLPALAVLAVLAAASGAAPADLQGLDRAVMAEINFARTQPQAYAETLQPYRAAFHGKIVQPPGRSVLIRTNEGVAAVDEAIAFLQEQAPLTPLAASSGLADAAQDQVRDQGPSGLVGHVGTDGSNPVTRIERYGAWTGVAAEDIGYGYRTGREVVRQLIVDDGVPDRGHRVNIFNPRLRLIGVACGPHSRYQVMCVVDFASSFRPE
jgi:uncharacterized protein YkwD